MFTGQISQLKLADPARLQLLGYELLMNNQYEEALRYFQTNVLFHPDCVPAYIDLASALLDKAGTRRDHFTKAIEILRIALEIDPNNAIVYKILSEAYSSQSDFEQAYAYAHKAYELNPNKITVLINYANNLKFRGDLEQAAQLYRQVIQGEPNNVYAYYNLFLIEKVTPAMPEFEACKSIEDKVLDLSVDKKIYLYSALAKAYSDIVDYPVSFAYLKKANDLKRASFTDYNVTKDINAFDALQNTFTEELLESDLASIYHAYNAGDIAQVNKILGIDIREYPTPVFILGMPRSGSTLVEQIVSSHSLVHGGGELNYIRQACSGLYVNDARSLIKSLSLDGLRSRVVAYLELIKQSANGARYITDKMPGNFAYLGFIKLMLPQAKIIHTTRDPMATCFSCYKQLFEQSHPYSYDLDDLGRYYQSYSKLMQHYDNLFASPRNPIYEVNHEILVAQQHDATEQLLTYCDLDFELACLDYHKNTRTVNTASLAQVRKPIFISAKFEWENYKEFLQPLYQALAISP